MAPLKRTPDRLPFLHLLPNMVTILGLCAGLTAIRFVFFERYEFAALLIIFAAAIDGLDGLLARRINATSTFGAELDTLSDFLNFGVAPGILMFQFALTDASDVGWIFVLVYVICCCMRLARFNVNRDMPVAGRAQFTGVPAPAGALLAMLPLFLTASGVIRLDHASYLVAPYLALVGYLMISTVPTPSPKGMRIQKDKAGLLLIGLTIVVGAVFTRFWLLMAVIDLIYVAVVIYSLVSARRRRDT